MGIRFMKKSPESQCTDSHNQNCEYLRRGFCKRCTCDKCDNGYTRRIDDMGQLFSRKCGCMKSAYSRHLLEKSGLDKLAERCTLDSYIPKEDWQKGVKEKALEYVANWKEKSFFISGQSGSGKTHICTAICNEAVRSGASLRYFRWVEDGTKLKGLLFTPAEYEKEIKKLVACDLVYLDDLFKIGTNPADLRLAYEIINSRYIAGKPIIISSERSLPFIRDLSGKDGEAIAGRIFEMCEKGKFCIGLTGAEKNMRFAVAGP